MNSKQLRQKLAAHRFTVVAPAQENDPDVLEYKRKERLAQKRAEKRAEIKAQEKSVQVQGLTVKVKGANAMQKALLKASK